MAASLSTRPSLSPLLLPLLLYLLPYHSPTPPVPTTTASTPKLTPTQISLLSATITTRLHTLANITTTPHYTNRPYLSPASLRAQAQILSWMQSANLSATIDAAGNVIGDLRCSTTPRDILLLGSHHDTVPRAGRFDGTLGVVAAISVAHVLGRAICRLPFDIRVIAFDDEEGNNVFGSTNLGARAYTGTIDWHRHVADQEAFINQYRTLHSVRDPIAAIDSAKGETPLAYLELHLEQGPVLETRRKSVGVVDVIAGQTRMQVSLKGESGHAGTVPMSMRHDALAAAAEGIVDVGKVSRNVVATVGKLSVSPGVANVIPGETVLSVDIRSASDASRTGATKRIAQRFIAAGRKHGVQVQVDVLHEVPAVRMSPWVTTELARTVDGGVVTSGAGHDAQILANITSVGMLFVRCRGGVSHTPDEFVRDDDVLHGATALLNAVFAIGERVSDTRSCI